MQAEGSGESTHLHRLNLAFVTVPKSRGEDSGESAHLCRCSYWTMQLVSPEPRHSTEISYAGLNGSGSALAAGSILSGFV